jgi:hypothetical protein
VDQYQSTTVGVLSISIGVRKYKIRGQYSLVWGVLNFFIFHDMISSFEILQSRALSSAKKISRDIFFKDLLWRALTCHHSYILYIYIYIYIYYISRTIALEVQAIIIAMIS